MNKKLAIFFLALITIIFFSSWLIYAHFYHIHFLLSGKNVDNVFYSAMVRGIAKWGNVFSATAMVPFGGLFNITVPMNVWFNPGWLCFIYCKPSISPELTSAIFLTIYIISIYCLSRALNLARGSAVMASILASILSFPPYNAWFDFFVQFELNPSVALILSVLIFSLAITIKISEKSSRFEILIFSICISSLLIFILAVDVFWASVAGFATAPFFAVLFLSKPYKQCTSRILAWALALLIVSATGLVSYLLAMRSFLARVMFSAELPSEIQDFVWASSAWHGWSSLSVYLFLTLGWVISATIGKGNQRSLALGCLLQALAVQLATILYVFTPINWPSYPLPCYLEICGLPFYTVATINGYTSLAHKFSRLLRENHQKINFIKNSHIAKSIISYISANIQTISCVAVIVIVLVCPVGYHVWLRFKYPFELHEQLDVSEKIIHRISDELSISPGGSFRGSLAVVLDADNRPYDHWKYTNFQHKLFKEFGGFLDIPKFWIYDIPTLNEYGQMVTPQLYYFASRLLAHNGDYQSRNEIEPTVIDSRIMTLLGVKLVLTDQLADIDNGTEIDRFVGNEGTTLRLIRFSEPNLGQYSPTHFNISSEAATTIKELRNEKFLPSEQAISDEVFTNQFVPLDSILLSVHKGGLHVKGTSKGISLAILPLQFSNCLKSSDENIKIVRVDLVLTGVVFNKMIDTDITNSLGYFSSKCRSGDVGDMDKFNIKSDGEVKLPPFTHPLSLF